MVSYSTVTADVDSVTVFETSSRFVRGAINNVANGLALVLHMCEYVKTNVPGPDFDGNQFMEEFVGCTCSSNCDQQSCPCIQLFGPAYNDKGQLLESWCIDGNDQKRTIFECGDNCACKCRDCCLRLVYNGISVKLNVFETPRKGFGLQAVSMISRLSFVCEYAGEVVGECEARLRLKKNQRDGNMNYVIAVKEYSSSSRQFIYIDPCHIGNIGRFINHSCDPNLIMITIRVNHPVPRLALFARRDISPGEELTFDYSGTASLQTSFVQSCKAQETMDASSYQVENSNKDCGDVKRSICLCDSVNCTGYLPLDVHIFDQ